MQCFHKLLRLRRDSLLAINQSSKLTYFFFILGQSFIVYLRSLELFSTVSINIPNQTQLLFYESEIAAYVVNRLKS